MTALTERVVNGLAARISRRHRGDADPAGLSRRGFIGTATLAGAALAVEPWGYLTTPQSAYAATCGTDAACSDGYSAFCCTINKGSNTCPPNTYPGGWWKADRSSYCGGAARYYIDCNAKPGYHFTCRCADYGTCDHRLVACNVFRYGQCNTQVAGVTAVVCRQISCRPPWEIYPGHCGTSSATDQNTVGHTAPCLTSANTFPPLKVYPTAPTTMTATHALHSGKRLTAKDRHTSLLMAPSGNLDVENDKGLAWSTRTAPRAKGGYAVLSTRGELTVRRPDHTVVWTTGPAASVGAWRLEVLDSGNVVITDGKTVHWSTHTHTG